MDSIQTLARRKRVDRPPPDYPKTCARGFDLTWVRTSVLAQYCNPYEGCWIELDSPLALYEVSETLEDGLEALHPPFPSWTELDQWPRLKVRQMHAQKVAWFVRHGFQDPLHVDVGMPSIGCHVNYLVEDGNHRLAAAIFRQHTFKEDPWLPLAISGDLRYARQLGLC